ncbi:MAG: Sec-independent protein translocase subunit TatB [Sulfurospirillum sp.]|nr:Sec-independent protein translocase subunit TatB [Sulfurospirillum sp.]MBL0703496.1 Sec-independent protein translocase subunit TatB [Sulfurospirillum sp.]
MFGISFVEITIIAVIAVLFLGPDKLPSAMIQIAKFFKTFKSSINDAKSSFEQEIKIQELKEDTLKYKKKFDSSVSDIKKTITFDELEDIKESTKDIADTFKNINKIDDIKNNPINITKNKNKNV